MKKNNTLGENIRWWRKSKSLSQTDFAALIGKKTSVISAYEKGLTEPPVSTVKDMASIFNVSFDEIMNVPLWEGNLNGNPKGNPITLKTENIEKLHSQDWIDNSSHRNFLITAIVSNIEMINQTIEILKKMSEQFNVKFNESKICSRFMSTAKRLDYKSMLEVFEKENSKTYTHDFLESFISVVNESYKALLDDLQSFSFYVYILSDANDSE